eukprot:5600204-Pyramimonas_sp.AAC.3
MLRRANAACAIANRLRSVEQTRTWCLPTVSEFKPPGWQRCYSKGPSQQPNEDKPKPETKEEEAFRLLRGSNTVHRFQSKSADLGLVDYLLTGWRSLTRKMATATISKADACFDEEDFLDSATDAFVTVNELVGDGNLDALRPMLSGRLHAAISTVCITLLSTSF